MRKGFAKLTLETKRVYPTSLLTLELLGVFPPSLGVQDIA